MAEVAAHLPTRRRGAVGLLIDPTFGGLFWGKLLSAAGVWVHGVVAAIVIFDATGSALAVGLVSMAQFAPQLFLTPLSGTWADRGHAWGQMVGGRVLCAIGSAGLAVWMWLSGSAGHRADGGPDGWGAAWPVLAASVVVGLGFVLGGPAQQSIIPRLVRHDELPMAMTLNTTPMTFARVCGPAIGAFVTSHVGPAAGFAIAAGTHALFTAILLCLRFPEDPERRDGADFSVRTALRYVRAHRPLLLVLVAVTAAGVGSEPTITLAPALADDLGGSAALVGMLTSAFGLGAAVGLFTVTLVARLSRHAVVACGGLAAMAIGLILAAALPWTPAALGGFGLTGLGFTWAMSSLGTLVQLQAPPALRGRIMALWMVGFLGGRPVAAFVLGGVADATTVHLSVASMALVLALAAWLCRPRRLA